jgi:hypothetical protein
MSITNSFRRLKFAALAGAMLALHVGAAHAQVGIDPAALGGVIDLRTNGQFILLERRVTKLEQNTDVFKLRADMDKAIAKLTIDVAQLQGKVALQESLINGLLGDVAALKAQRPADPGKTPPGKTPDPAKPADGQVLSLRAPFTVKDASGKVIFKVDAVSGSLPRAIIGNPAGARAEIGIAVGGAAVVGLYDDSNQSLSTLVGDPKGSYLRVHDNEQTANLGKFEADGTGLFLRKENKTFGEFSVGKAGYGIVRVAGADGKSVGGLFAAAEGGGLALTGPGGGKSAVSLSVAPSGGKVRVFPVGGGSARAELVAEGNIGALNVFGSSGTNAVTVASVESQAGKIEITNSSGNIVVQAGQQKNGRGMVTTGPFEGGLAGTLGAGLTPASTIVGQMKGK